jgi:hypothetical protein
MLKARFPQLILTALSIAVCPVLSWAQRGAAATWHVQKYAISLTLPGAGRVIPITASLTAANVSDAPAATLTLRISPLAEVTGVKINGTTAEFSKSEEKVNAVTSLQRIVTRLPAVAPGGIVNLTVDYKLNVKENSAVAAFSPAGAQFLPLSYWYPTPNSWYFARGADSAPFRLSAAVPGQTVVSAGTETSGAFDEKLNAQPFFFAGSWDTLDAGGVMVMMPKGSAGDGQKRAAELAAVLKEARAYCESIFGTAPIVPLRIVAVRRGAGFSGGGTVTVDEAVFRRSKIDSLTAMNIAEAAAKLWVDGSVTVGGDGHGVITEGLARYIATQFLESKFGKDIADIERLRQRVSYAAVSKRDSPLTTVAPIDDFYYPEVANKGAMVWRILAKRVGQTEFTKALRSAMQDSKVDLAEIRSGFPEQKELLDYLFDKVTDMNLLAGVPVAANGETKVALRNTGSTDVTVDITATTTSGERTTAPTTIRATSFGEIVFKTPAKITRVEIDSEKMYPQLDYSDDVAPRESTDSDPLLAAKRQFDKQDYAAAETAARTLLRDRPRFDDLRVLLGRALLAQNKNVEAEKEFRSVLDERLPTARSLAWANVGLAEAASKANRNDEALTFANAAIMADGEYGATLAARNLRNKLNAPASVDPGVKAFFADFDRAAAANKKSDVEALVVPGEITRFTTGVAGSTQQWQTTVLRVDRLDADTVLVEADMAIKLFNKEVQGGMAVYRLSKVGGAWRLAAVDMFEVR